MEKQISSQEENKIENESGNETGVPAEYSRREAVKALAKYSSALGGAAAIVVSADGLVSEASAYGMKKKKKRRKKKRKGRKGGRW